MAYLSIVVEVSQAFEDKLSVRWGNAVGGLVGGHDSGCCQC